MPDTIKRGKNIENTQPDTTRLEGQLVITARGRPNPEIKMKLRIIKMKANLSYFPKI